MSKSKRRCQDCKTDISLRGNKSIRCAPCQQQFRVKRDRSDTPTEAVTCVDADETCSQSRLKRGRCSVHYYLARRDNGGQIPQTPRNCATCGTTFTPVRSDALCCSTLCNWRRQDTLGRVDHPERSCATCGETFKPHRVDQDICSVETCGSRESAAQMRWAVKNRDKTNEYSRARHRQLRTNPHSVQVSERDWQRLVNRFHGCCAYCGGRPRWGVVRDHVIPVGRGGRDSIGNLLPTCRSCNSSKGDDFLVEFKTRGLGRLAKRLQPVRPGILKPEALAA